MPEQNIMTPQETSISLAPKHLSLNGEWQFRQQGETQWQTAKVPGSNFSDLLRNGVICDPFYRNEEDDLQWIEHCDWEYKKTFIVTPAALLHCEHVLVFEGLDTYCDVYLNGILILESRNMFVGHRVPCKQWIRAGDNVLHIKFRSPIKEAMPLYQENGFTYPAENDKSEERLSVFTRKAPYHFGWDWGPRFVTSGIWRNVTLEFVNKARIADVHVRQLKVNEQQANLSFEISLDCLFPIEGNIEISCNNISGFDVIQCPLSVTHKGSYTYQLSAKIEQPKLWWPNGLGEAFLHQFTVKLVDKLGDVEQRQFAIGIRSVEVINLPDADGESFYLNVNGQPTFMKGANYIPSDSFLENVSNDKYQRIFQDAVDANMNMLRVWGGGIYENDAFYRLADENGILIWQDFMFACSLYPADERFIENVKEEVVYNVTRLRNHACLALWCGNNETEMGIEFWHWPKTFNYSAELFKRLKKEYDLLFKHVLPELAAKLDPDRFYFSSSPIGFWENKADDKRGDNHYWGVWHGEEPFEEYKRRIPRFMSEFGFQSFPILASVKNYAAPEDWHLESSVMRTHQKHPRGNSLIAKYMESEYLPAKDFESFLYLSQVQQALGLKIAFEAHRSAMPFCMGTLYWQFNDCWPVASWSGIDYYGRWKALHYQAKRSFSPVAVFVEQIDGELDIRLVSDLRENTACRIELKVCTFAGETVWHQQSDIVINPNSSESFVRLNCQTIQKGHAANALVFVARLISADSESAISQLPMLHEDFYYFVPAKKLALTKPDINLTCEHDGQEWVISLLADRLTRQVHLSFSANNDTDESGVVNFSDNFFDLLPNESKSVRIRMQGEAGQEQASFLPKLQVMSLVDSYDLEENKNNNEFTTY